MTTRETFDGKNLPTWTPLHLDYTRTDDRPQVKHYRNRSAYDKTLYVGRGSVLGNPFRPLGGEAGRQTAIKKYRHWLWQQLCTKNPAVLGAMGTITADTV